MSVASIIYGLSTFLRRGVSRQLVYNVMDFGPNPAKGDHQAVTDGVMAAGSAVLTSASASFAAADVGKLLWVVPTDRTSNPRLVNDGTITAASNTLTSANAAFTTADVSKWVSVAGAGIAGAPLVAQIIAYTNATTVSLAANAQTSVAARAMTDGVANAWDYTITSATAAFTSADVGRTITIAGAGMSASLYTATIVAVASGTAVSLDTIIATSVSAATVTITGANLTIFSLGTSSNVAQRVVSDAAINVGTSSITLTSASANFAAADVGRFITISGAGTSGATLTNQIVSVTTPATAVLQCPASTTVTNATLTLIGVRTVSDAAISANGMTLTSATANFALTDVGALITIPSAGLGGAALIAQIIYANTATTATISTPAANTIGAGSCTIAPPGPLAGTIVSVQSANQCTLSDSASIACAGAGVGWATNDTAAIQYCLDHAPSGGTIYFPPATYVLTWAGLTTIYGNTHYALSLTASNLTLKGSSATLLLAGGNQRNISAIVVGDLVNPVSNVVIEDFTIDGNAKAGRSPAISMAGGNSYVIPSKVGAAPIWGADDFLAAILVRGPFTSHQNFPRIGQLSTKYITIRRCAFSKWTNAAFEAISYSENIRFEDNICDGQGLWANRIHMDGTANGTIRGNILRNQMGTGTAFTAIGMLFNGDTGYRPTARTVIENNMILNGQGGMAGIGVIGSNNIVRGNIIDTLPNYAISVYWYYSTSNTVYAGCQYNLIAENEIINCASGILIDNPTSVNAPTRSGTANLGSGSTSLQAWGGTALTSADIGNWVTVAGAGPNGDTLVTSIKSVQSSTQCTLVAQNLAGVSVTAGAVTIGGQANATSSHNKIIGNNLYCDATMPKATITFNGATPLVSYGANSRTIGGTALSIANGTAVYQGGNQFEHNRVTGFTTSIQDNSFGVGVVGSTGTGAATVLYNMYLNNDFRTEAFNPTRFTIANKNILLDGLFSGGRVLGQQGGNAGNVFGTPYKMLQSVTANWTPGAIGAGASASTTVTITGAAVGDTVAAQYNQVLAAGLILTAQITSANTATATIFNATAGSLTPTTGSVRLDWTGH